MGRIAVVALLVLSAPSHAFRDLFGDHSQIAILPDYPLCKYKFKDWGRNGVEVTNLENGHISHCSFSRTERINRDGGSFRTAIYMQHYTCTDGTAAYYSTDWTGSSFTFGYIIDPSQPPLRCE